MPGYYIRCIRIVKSLLKSNCRVRTAAKKPCVRTPCSLGRSSRPSRSLSRKRYDTAIETPHGDVAVEVHRRDARGPWRFAATWLVRFHPARPLGPIHRRTIHRLEQPIDGHSLAGGEAPHRQDVSEGVAHFDDTPSVRDWHFIAKRATACCCGRSFKDHHSSHQQWQE